jgi:hypothetical protein
MITLPEPFGQSDILGSGFLQVSLTICDIKLLNLSSFFKSNSSYYANCQHEINVK